jgi:hypothetical protein
VPYQSFGSHRSNLFGQLALVGRIRVNRKCRLPRGNEAGQFRQFDRSAATGAG